MMSVFVIPIAMLTILGMFLWLCWYTGEQRKKRALKKRLAHDPMDWRLTVTSRAWDNDHFCPQCQGSISHSEYMANICFSCGHSNGRVESFKRRSYRQIWDGEQWIWQYKYGNGPKEYRLSKRKLHS